MTHLTNPDVDLEFILSGDASHSVATEPVNPSPDRGAAGWRLACLRCDWRGVRVYQDLRFAERLARALSDDRRPRCATPEEARWLPIVRLGVATIAVGGDVGPGSTARLVAPRTLSVMTDGGSVVGDARGAERIFLGSRRVVVDSDCARWFAVVDVEIGGRSQRAPDWRDVVVTSDDEVARMTGGVPDRRAFRSFDPLVGFGELAVVVRNLDDAPRAFYAYISGDYLRFWPGMAAVPSMRGASADLAPASPVAGSVVRLDEVRLGRYEDLVRRGANEYELDEARIVYSVDVLIAGRWFCASFPTEESATIARDEIRRLGGMLDPGGVQ